MRRHGLPAPYEQLKALTRGLGVDGTALRGAFPTRFESTITLPLSAPLLTPAFVSSLQGIPAEDKQRLLDLTPQSYVGLAPALAAAVPKLAKDEPAAAL